MPHDPVRIRSRIPVLPAACAALFITVCASAAPPALVAAEWPITMASYLSGGAGDQATQGAAILSDGTIVLAVNLGPTTAGGTQRTLGDATAASRGAIVHLQADGSKVLSITRVAGSVHDLAVDDQQRLHVAAWDDGVLVLDSSASTLIRRLEPGRVLRVDAGKDGTCAALVVTTTDPHDGAIGGAQIAVYASDGKHHGTYGGLNFTQDVAVDSDSKLVFSVGFRNATANDANSGGKNPVQIPYLRAMGYNGSIAYTAYNWSTDSGQEDHLNEPENNMADARGYRCVLGDNGKLYCGFEVAGGNHLFRYDPFDIDVKVSHLRPGIDKWHQLYNTQSQHKSVVTQHQPATGKILRYQEFCTRYGNTGNTLRIHGGDLAIDAAGTLYFAGSSASGLPMPPSTSWDGKDNGYKPKTGETPINRGGSTWTYTGGAFLMVLDQDLGFRRMTLLAGSGPSHCVAVRRVGGALQQVVLGGSIQIKGSEPTTSKGYGFTYEAGVGPFVTTAPLNGTAALGAVGDGHEAFALLIDIGAKPNLRSITIQDSRGSTWAIDHGVVPVISGSSHRFDGLDVDRDHLLSPSGAGNG